MNHECESCSKDLLAVRNGIFTEGGDFLCPDCFEEWMIEKAEKYDREEP